MRKAGELLDFFFDENLAKTARGYQDFFSGWKELVGERIAAHSRILELEKNVLIVEADHPGWIQLIQMRRKEILDAINKAFPSLAVSVISIRLQKSTVSIRKEQRIVEPPMNREVSDAPISKNLSGYDTIHDEGLKAQLQRLEAHIRERSQSS